MNVPWSSPSPLQHLVTYLMTFTRYHPSTVRSYTLHKVKRRLLPQYQSRTNQGIITVSVVCAVQCNRWSWYVVMIFFHYLSVPQPCASYSMENIFPLLRPMASKWQSLGEALSLDEHHLDCVFTNDEGDEVCLEEMLKLYDETMENRDIHHNWKDMVAALRKIDEVAIAEKIQDLYIKPCK